MQTRIIKPLMLAVLSAALVSFSANWGGDAYQIYVNKKLVLKEHVADQKGVKSFQLDKASYNDQVDIYYSHCGQVGKNRSIAIKDESNRLLKELHFADYNGSNSGMSFRVSDVMNKKDAVEKLNLYYSSHELTGGRLLATIILGTESKSKP